MEVNKINQSESPKAVFERFARLVESFKMPTMTRLITTKPAPKLSYGGDGALRRKARQIVLSVTGVSDSVTNKYRKARRQAQRNRRAQRSSAR